MNLEEKIVNGWNISAEGFSWVVRDDFQMPNRGIWEELLLANTPREGKLKILDVGTGPGLFATILSMNGHDVTGIDISPKMLEQAKINSSNFGVAPKYEVMNSQNLTFADESFDMIVSRNVVWSMDSPRNAYKSWLRVLKPGGRVVVFDGDYLKDEREPEYKIERQKIAKEYMEIFKEEPEVSYKNYEEARGWRVELPLAKEKRPEWDVRTMEEIGYKTIDCTDIWHTVFYDEKSKLLYRNLEFFMLCGDKK